MGATTAPGAEGGASVPGGSGRKLVVLMITAFMDMVGLLMVIPLLPFYATELGANAFVVTLLVASFSVAQLVSAPLWGRFSDRYGRRPALLVGLVASAVAYVVFAYADSLWLLFLSRIVQGAGGGTVSVIQAYVADATRPEDRAKSLGWLSAATNLGVTIGPVFGSATLTLGRAAPGLLAAGLCVVNIVFAWIYLTESHDVSPQSRANTKPVRRSREAVARVLTHPGDPASRLIWIYAVAMGAFSSINAILALFLMVRFAVTEQTIGFFFTYIGAISVLTRALALGHLVDRFGEARLSRLGLTLLALGLFSIPFARGYVSLAIAVALLPLGTAFTFPCVTSLLSRVTPGNERGLYMGVQQTFGGITRSVFPILAGLAFDHLGVGVPFYIAALLVASTLLLGRDMADYTRARGAVA
ncbi:MAG TPA: MFS transporter [Gemmatimonadaceae bacterium]|jgi:multidrug resistance protein|nr:MFS transporter [Gemmatimonadaceae bacterium]